MATFTRRTVTTVRQEFSVPAAEPYGAAAAEVEKAWAAAQTAYWQANGVAQGGPIPDNAIVFRPGDDEIVISFETSAEA